jgi:hypothetical protein
VPIDPKTGYKHEPWHLRFVGTDAAKSLHAAFLASGPGTPGEITLEQWLRARRGLAGDAELPVCDGCECGACETMAAAGDKAPCGDASLLLDATGHTVSPEEPPHLLDASVSPPNNGVRIVTVKVHAPAHTPTQPPVTTEQEPLFDATASFTALTPYAGTQPHRYDDLPGAWRVAIDTLSLEAPPLWPWRVSLAKADLEATWNRANVRLPSQAGDVVVKVRVALLGVHKLRVTLLRDGQEHETREVVVP